MLASFGLTRRGMAAWVEHESEPESEALPLTTKDRVDASSAPASVREALGWGALAECIISVCCPLVMRGEVNVTATALNLLGPLLGGMARALDEQSGDSAVRRSCAAFQTGFIGVITSFSFMVDQGAQLADDPLRGDLRHGWLYIGTMLAAGCGCFVLGRALLGALLCNTLACLLLVTLRVGEAAALLTEHSLLVTKLRTSCCGALSICGGLSALVVAGQGRHEASGRKDRPPPRHAMRALVNLGLHAYVALAVCAVLPGMTTLGFEYTRSSRPVGS